MERSSDTNAVARPAQGRRGDIDPLRIILENDGTLVHRTAGRSMRPLIRSGKDEVTIVPLKGEIQPWDVVLYGRMKQGERQYVLHRVLRVEADVYLILGDNCTQVERIPREDILGVMVALARKGKAMDCDGWRYRAYLRWWVKPWRGRVAVLRCTHALRHAVGAVLPRGAKERLNRLLGQ